MIEPLAGQTGSSASGVLWLSDLLEHASGTAAPTAAGSATGIAAAMSAALVAMAAERSRGSWAGAGGAIAQAGTLQQRCLELARADVEAFGRAAAALERGTDVEEPLRETVDLLLALGEAACDIGELAALVSPHCERLVHADAEAAALRRRGRGEGHRGARAREPLGDAGRRAPRAH